MCASWPESVALFLVCVLPSPARGMTECLSIKAAKHSRKIECRNRYKQELDIEKNNTRQNKISGCQSYMAVYFFSWRASCCSFASRVTHLYEPLLPSIHSLRIRIYSGSQKHAGTITGVTLALAFLLKSIQCVSHQHMCIL